MANNGPQKVMVQQCFSLSLNNLRTLSQRLQKFG